ncbi:hypothetical protein IC582_027185 [Cucumis melo]|uniref:Uncharacterized protein LOC103497997 n=1 Tax=Cucumis melo TaxID=3656 RepID=A0A1S3C8I1_CUCME|nr:uncharacterized protein LOC103497997 [Cucumis melo]
MVVPRFAGFRSSKNQKYMNVVKSDDEKIPNFVQYSSDNLATSTTKFSFVASHDTAKNLYHIVCIYNQKYLRAESSSSRWICATALEPNEDQSDWGCTLFRITWGSTEQRYDLFHMYYGQPVDLKNDSSHPNCLYIYDQSSTIYNHSVLDWEVMSILPQHVVFKGDNNKYLKIHNQDSHDFLRFLLDDPQDSSVQQEVVITSDGKIRIKGPNNKFWRASPNWIWIDSTDTSSNNQATVFQPCKISNNVICLRNLGNNMFCSRTSADWKESCLSANDHAMSNYSRLTVEEAVLSREIYNVQYRLSDGRIYGENILAVDFQGAMNGSDEVNHMDFNFSYEEEESQCWSSTVGMKLAYTMTIEAGIPLIMDTNIVMSGGISESYTWGQTNKKSTPKKTPYSLEVQPRTSVKVSAMLTKGYCDVPFSYTQRDILVDGQTRITEHDDGLFTGFNCYNFHYQSEDVTSLSAPSSN